MCLFEITIPQEKSGIGYKVVRPTEKEDEFLPYYAVFDKEGTGGALTNRKYHRPGTNYVLTRIIYKLGRTYRVKHHRWTKARYDPHRMGIEQAYIFTKI